MMIQESTYHNLLFALLLQQYLVMAVNTSNHIFNILHLFSKRHGTIQPMFEGYEDDGKNTETRSGIEKCLIMRKFLQK